MMNNELENSVKKIVWAIRRIVSLISLDSKLMFKRFGVTGPQSLVIKAIYNSETALSSADLSRYLNVTPSNITGIIDRLEEQEIVKRVPKKTDRRTVFIELTEKGKSLHGKLSDPIEEKLMRGLADLTATEIFGIYSALDKIINVIGPKEIKQSSVDQE